MQNNKKITSVFLAFFMTITLMADMGKLTVFAADVPGAPTNFTVKPLASDDDKYLITWEPPTTGGKVEYYIIQSNFNYGFGNEKEWVDFREIHDCFSGNAYVCGIASNEIRLVAANDVGKSQGTASVVLDDLKGKTPSGIPNKIDRDDLTLAQDGVSVTLDWKAHDSADNPAEYFEIARWDYSKGGPDFYPIAYIAAVPGRSSYSWTDDAVINGQTYRYSVRAANYNGYSSYYEDMGYWFDITVGSISTEEKDREAADAVIALIAALPTDPELSDEATVNRALDAYAALSEKARSMVGESAQKKLSACDGIMSIKRLIADGKMEGSEENDAEIERLVAEAEAADTELKNVKSQNPLSVKGKTATVKYSKLKNKSQVLKVKKVISTTKKGQGKITYTKVSGNKKISVNKTTGNATIKKGLKKGTYKVKIKVRVAGNENYEPSKITVIVKIKVV